METCSVDAPGSLKSPQCLLIIGLGVDSCLILVFGIYRCIHLIRSPNRIDSPSKTWPIIKSIFCAVSALCYITKLFLSLMDTPSSLIHLISFALLSAAWTLVGITTWLEYKRGRTSHWFTRLWWLITFFLASFDMQAAVGLQRIFSIVAFVATTMICAIGLYLHQDEQRYEQVDTEMDTMSDGSPTAMTEEIEHLPRKFDYSKRSIWMRVYFDWMTPIFQIGYRKQLQQEHLAVPSLNARDSASDFQRAWQNEILKPKPRLNRALFNAFKTPIIKSGIFKVISEASILGYPFLIREMILFTGDPSLPMTRGLVLSVLLALTLAISSLTEHWWLWTSHHSATHIRAALITAVYEKSFRLNSKSRAGKTIGDIINIQSVDVQKYQDAVIQFHDTWAHIFRFITIFSLLIALLGPSALAGFGVLLLILPFFSRIASKRGAWEQKGLDLKDERTKEMSEMLSGIRVLKFFGWEESFSQKIQKIRDQEIRVLKVMLIVFETINGLMWITAPGFVNLATFSTFILTGHDLPPALAFTAVSFFTLMERPFVGLPLCINFFVDLSVSTKRITEFLLLDELDPDVVDRRPCHDGVAVAIDDGIFSWTEGNVTLDTINLKVKEGSFTAVVGAVGSGKSSLLSALLGNIDKISGKVRVSGKCAYVSQQAWIRNATVKNNILFGKAYDAKKYHAVLEACQLKDDLKILSAGDATEIGERGINLSGGQKQRIALARAVYQDCDVYLIDDCLSAVDAHVGQEIFNQVLMGLLKTKTRVLVTHQLQHVHQVEQIVVLKDGRVSECSTFDELMKSRGEFHQLITDHVSKKENQVEVQVENKIQVEDSTSENEVDSKGIISQEDRETGRVALRVWKDYLAMKNWKHVLIRIITLFCFAGMPFMGMSRNWWLAKWTSSTTISVSTYLIVSAVINVSVTFLAVGKTSSFYWGCLESSKSLHNGMLARVLKSKTAFFDSTPMGRILNRFSRDVYSVDKELPQALEGFGDTLFLGVAALIAMGIAAPAFLVVLMPIGFVVVKLQGYYLSSSREFKRMESINRSPIFSQFSETLNGVDTIRCFQVEENFHLENLVKIDQYIPSFISIVGGFRWLGVRIEGSGALLVFLATLFVVTQRDYLSPGMTGLLLVYTGDITWIMNWLLRTLSSAETSMVSVERITNLARGEEEGKPSEVSPASDWPSHGAIEFHDISMRYRSDLDPILRGITLKIKAREKVGIVGRTGAGKSSLILALFRMVELDGGMIEIDGVDISQLRLREMRSKLSIIPQESTLFVGSVRQNLDPFNDRSDRELWDVLRICSMEHAIESLPSKLESSVGENGSNFSVGQRQLICLARAILKRSKILIMDEATASVDYATDELIQKTIREQFKEATVLTIAHRINTIMDYDKVLVMDKGTMAEFDAPSVLLNQEGSIFRSLASRAGIE
eukprot:TRINITY_DN3467_c0_g1_i1.p1 TRINITY_DN3467_c0_g1~~TRINITY_DN3467_c0_g1_i1.p1  ORF type:complete len:1423 (+),score=460.83 TRINITY_DN3467_c0_g1_i1:67-4335(+)